MPNLMPQVTFTIVPMASPGSKTAQLIWSSKIAANAVTGPKSRGGFSHFGAQGKHRHGALYISCFPPFVNPYFSKKVLLVTSLQQSSHSNDV